MTTKSTQKVTVFVVRQPAASLLVFDHPTAGVQVPAGTVEDGEAFLAAARRELEEEAGLTFPVERFTYLGTLENAQVERRLYRLETDEAEVPATAWVQAADGHVFRFRWVPLAPPPQLEPPQDTWLAHAWQGLQQHAKR